MKTEFFDRAAKNFVIRQYLMRLSFKILQCGDKELRFFAARQRVQWKLSSLLVLQKILSYASILYDCRSRSLVVAAIACWMKETWQSVKQAVATTTRGLRGQHLKAQLLKILELCTRFPLVVAATACWIDSLLNNLSQQRPGDCRCSILRHSCLRYWSCAHGFPWSLLQQRVELTVC